MDLRVQGTLFATCTGNHEEIVGTPSTEEPDSAERNLKVNGDINAITTHDQMAYTGGNTHLTSGSSLFDARTGRHMIWSDELHQITAPTIITEASKTISHRADLITLAGSDTISMKGGGKIVLESNNAIELRVGNSFISLDQGGIDIQGFTLRLNSGGGVGRANEPLPAEFFEALIPYEALPADDGRIHKEGSGRGHRRKRERHSWKLKPHSPPPMKPPPLPKPKDIIVPFDTGGVWKSMEWKQTEAWCSEEVALRFEADSPSSADHATAFIRNTADGEVVTGVGVEPRDGFFEQPVKLCDILPRSLATEVEDSRELDAWLDVGLYSKNSLVLRFLSNLPWMYYDEGRARFGIQIHDHRVEISNKIPYKRGGMGYVISLGDLAPDDAGGELGIECSGFSDWRYCKKITIHNNPSRLAYWDGTHWRIVPEKFDSALGTKLYGTALWEEDGRIKTQYSDIPWPDPLPEWANESIAALEKAKPRWSKAIGEFWSAKFDLKRDQCHGHDPRCCRYAVQCYVGFRETDILVKRGIIIGEDNTRENSSAWSLLTSPHTAIHEFGHHLGNPDEYEGAPSVDIWVNGDGAVLGIDEQSVMNDGNVMRRRHLLTIAQALAELVQRETGKSYTYTPVELIP